MSSPVNSNRNVNSMLSESPEESLQRQLFNQQMYDIQPMKKPSRRYLVLSSQNVGSDFLCRSLCSFEGRFGLPSEYLKPDAIRALSARLIGATPDEKVPLSKYLSSVEQVRTTPDGWFGINVQPKQLLNVVGNQRENTLRFVANFDRLVLITRRDKLGQAVSTAISSHLGKLLYDSSEPVIDDARIAALFPVIADYLSLYVQEERFVLDVGRLIAKPLVRIEYEDLQENSNSAVMNVVEFLAGDEQVVAADIEYMPIFEETHRTLAQKVCDYFLAFIAGHRSSVYLPKLPRTMYEPKEQIY